MCRKIIENIFCCPECKSDLKFKNNSALVCLNCNKEYEYDDNLIDFGVEEQKFVNNWSGANTQEEIIEHFKNMVKDGYFKNEDIANIQTEIDIDIITQQNNKAIGSIRKNYYSSENTMIVDLATGYGSIFSSKIGEGMNFDELKGKTIILTDLSKFVLQKVRERLKDQTKEINMIYAVCNISNLPFKDNSIDYISSVACFINSNCGAELLKEIKRVLNNKKRLGILEFLYEDNS
ncbi:MAG: methyltransferase domain-containing protein, partial [Candidatus Delongbacteria bacterium]|nr:methyltransferase domain-containing protein [Candidatus Delongbacteria bacterium]